MLDDQMKEIEITEEAARKYVADLEALNRLGKNRDFRKIIDNGFLKDEAVRLVHLKAHPSQSGAEEQKAIDDGITAIGYLQQFFIAIEAKGETMKRTLADCEVARQEIFDESGE